VLEVLGCRRSSLLRRPDEFLRFTPGRHRDPANLTLTDLERLGSVVLIVLTES
jgi:hypothetical protein